ncbi:MAG: hypothetical protein E7662_04730 [Ruminococcaceae bacterium]|nr:hypothetical protein [Oscillospiraceae bacterium]
MKKFLALALCVLMSFSAVAAIGAADEKNAYANDFEAVPVGAITKLDSSAVNAVKKEGVIEVVKFDGDNAIRVNHKDTGNKHDPYVNFVENKNGISQFGVESQFVLEYEVYFEDSCAELSWQVGMARLSTDDGTSKFQHSAIITGEDLALTVTGEETPAMNLKTKTWYTIAVAFDSSAKHFSVYVDGVCLAKDVKFGDDFASYKNEINLIRTAYQSFQNGDVSAYIDNVKVYNATQPRVVKQATPSAPAVPAIGKKLTLTIDTTYGVNPKSTSSKHGDVVKIADKNRMRATELVKVDPKASVTFTLQTDKTDAGLAASIIWFKSGTASNANVINSTTVTTDGIKGTLVNSSDSTLKNYFKYQMKKGESVTFTNTSSSPVYVSIATCSLASPKTVLDPANYAITYEVVQDKPSTPAGTTAAPTADIAVVLAAVSAVAASGAIIFKKKR